MPKTILIAGLGNPGRQYENTRHNAGFLAADALAASLGVDFSARQGGEYAKAKSGNNTIYILKPLTYMNLSGRAVSSFVRFHKIPLSDIVVVFDDMALPAGAVRMRGSGSAGGQKGMQSVIEQLGTQDIPRIRIGIGLKPAHFEGADFVLGKFTREEKVLLDKAIEVTINAIKIFAEKGLDVAMNFTNGAKQ